MNKLITKSFTYEGRRYYVRAKTENAAIEKMAAKKHELATGPSAAGGSITVRAWTKKALATYKPNISDRYRKEMEGRINKHILSEIGTVPVNKVTPLQCQNILNNQIGKSRSHISQLSNELFFIFDTARKNNLIIRNPAEDIIKPTGTYNRRRSITDYERKHLLAVFPLDPRYTLFELMLYCGCRPMEAANVMYEDITMIEGIPFLHIRGTKTINSDRLVPVPAAMQGKLLNTNKTGLVVTTNAGNKLNYTTYMRLVRSLKRQLNLSMGCKTYRNELMPPFPLAADFVPYLLRHTYCTDLKKAGVDVRIAKTYMGHADIKTTANIYDHEDISTLIIGARQMGL